MARSVSGPETEYEKLIGKNSLMSTLLWFMRAKAQKTPHEALIKRSDSPADLRALEPRIMFDAAGIISGVDGIGHEADQTVLETIHDSSDSAVTDSQDLVFVENLRQALDTIESSDLGGLPVPTIAAETGNATEVVIIDSQVQGEQRLLDAILPNADAYLLDDSRSAVEQITTILSQYSNLDSLHIVSHGGEGAVILGSDTLTLETLDTHHDDLVAWGDAVSAEGDILLYACQVAHGEGQRFVEAVAELTGTDIAASTDTTGDANLGGDWSLEAEYGDIDADVWQVFDQQSLEDYEQYAATHIDFEELMLTGGENSSPAFNEGTSASLTVNEGDGATSFTSLLDTTDTDSNQTLTWSQSSAPNNGSVVISSTATSTGSIGTSGATPDTATYEPTASTFGADSFQVTVEDSEGDTDSITINVTIADVDPNIGDETFTSITDSTAAGTSVGTVANTGDTDGLIFSITGGTGQSLFVINSSTGEVTVASGASLSAATVTLEVSVDDEDSDSTADDTATISITITSSSATAPSFSNLDGGSASWAGVGSSVTVDSDGTVSDTELDALNSGSGDYSSATLTVQRSGTAVTSDTFDFDTSSASFTVSGSDLKDGSSNTFGSFTNSNGVLTITFSGSNVATTALVSDVLQHITYRNDTPAGDATIEFTITDDTSRTDTATVTISTDTIYINDTGDTSDSDRNTVTLREAASIASSQDGTQSLVLDSSTFSGSDTITLGSDITLESGATLDLSNGSGLTITGSTITLGGNITITSGSGDSDTIASVIDDGSNTYGVIKSGTGTLTLSGTNTFDGGLSLSSGTLSVSADENLGSGTVTLAGDTTFQISGATTIDNAVTLSGAADISVDASVDVTFSGLLTSATQLNKRGDGRLILTNISNSTSYTSSTWIYAGTFSISDGNAFSSETINLSNGTLEFTDDLTIGNAIAIQSSGGTIDVSSGKTATLYGTISDSGALSKAGDGSLALTGTSTRTGTTTVSAGTMSISEDNGLGSGNVTLAAGSTLQFTDNVSTIDNAIALAGDATISTETNVVLSGVISGNYDLTKSGHTSSILTLSGTNTYVDTVLSAGTININSDSNLGSGSVTLATNAVLMFSSATSIDNSIVLNGDAYISSFADTTISSVISGSNNLSIDGGATLTLDGTNTFSGTTTVSAGTLAGDGSLAGAVSVSSGASIAPGNSTAGDLATGNLTFVSGATLSVELGSTTAGTGYDQLVVTGTVDITDATLSGTLINSFTPSADDVFTLINNDGSDAVTGTFDGLAEGDNYTFDNYTFSISYVGGDGNDVTLTYSGPTPTFSKLAGDSITASAGGSSVSLDSGLDATITDTDSTDFDGGNLTISITSGGVSSEDTLSVTNEGSITVSSNTVSYSGNTIGTITSDGTSGNDLVITFSGTNATPTAASALLQAIQYTHAGGSTPDTGERTMAFTIADGDGNTSTASSVTTNITPVVNSVSVPSDDTYTENDTLSFTVNFSEAITVDTNSGTPTISFDLGGSTKSASYASGSTTTALVFSYTVTDGDLDSDGIGTPTTITLNSGTLKDSAGNDIDTTLNSVASTSSVLVDAEGPSITEVRVPSDGSYMAGDSLWFWLDFDESLSINESGGTAYISFDLGGSTKQASLAGVNGSYTSVAYKYTVAAGDTDSDGIGQPTGLTLNGSTFTDSAGNSADTTLNSIGTTTSILVDTTAPTITSVSAPSDATYGSNENLDFTVNFSESVTVSTSTPSLSFDLGGSSKSATYQSGSGSTAVVFRYTVVSGDQDSDGIGQPSALSLNSGIIRDTAGNDASLTLNSVDATTNVLVESISITVSDSNVSISGASGTSGAYKIGDTVSTTWDNTSSGDNNSDSISSVSVDYSAFGGGSAVSATESSGTWTATYTIVSGSVDSTGANVSVTANHDTSNSTTTADTSNATVDAVAPTLTDGNISISGASGTSGAYKVGDTVTATWDNTDGGDNNSDTISTVSVDFSAFGGGSAVSASESAGTWTATYTVVEGSIDNTTLNIGVTATDNAGNTTTTADTTNATVDAVSPTLTDGSISISGASGTSGAYKVGDTVTATWD
ncbi:MAG: DUF4347 domain-containing protein, partial [Magnetococcales bacterium]|nr:DUF4347 domain-containing protein [Magnetococcales bacterium]